ncbi:MAG: hypothetical protein LQ346_004000 [Caloplaca aetnensis]|nr:MAG: hypothetical protein LQ346_004000 [Caloplaca aetnensis]
MSSPKNTDSAQREADEPLASGVTYNGKTYNRVREGLADILNLQPTQAGGKGPAKQSVFYNPIQQFNRDLSVLAIRVFAEDLAIIRRQRHERRLQNLAKGGKNGKKRRQEEGIEGKATAANGNDNVEDSDGLQKNKRKREDENHSAETEDPRATKKVKGSEEVDKESQHGPSAAIESPQQYQNNGNIAQDDANPVRVDVQPSGDSNEATNLTNVEVEQVQGDHHPQEARKDTTALDPSKTTNGLPPDVTPPLRILDALSATGLRALRYAKEISQVTSVTANDISASATASIKMNVAYNGLGGKISPTTGDAKAVMRHAANNARDSYHVVDLDPYGTAAPFLDAAVQAVTDGGLLCVTCTDSGVFASVAWLEKAFSQYGGLPWRGPQSHEAGLRIILNAIATSAARYGCAIEPLLSLNIDFYVRLFVRIKRAPVEVKCLANKTMIVYNCDQGCGAFSTQYLAHTREKEAKNGDKFHTQSLAQGPSATPECEHCGFKTHLAGPMWGGPLHNPHFISRVLDLLPSLDSKVYGTIPRIEGMLTLVLNETLFQEAPTPASSESASTEPFPSLDPALRDPHPFFFNPSMLSRTLRCSRPSDAQWRGALIGLGYRTTRSHTEAGSIRTDAPWTVIWEIMREWIRQKHPIKEGAVTKGMAGWEILQKDRSRRTILDAKQELRDAIDKVESAEGLRESVEAALYRISKKAESASDTAMSNGTGEQDGVVPGQKELRVVFDEKLGKEAAGKKLVRYQINPRAEWGPISRAKGGQ